MEHLAGQVADNPQQAQQLVNEDFVKCRNPVCNYWISPEEQESLDGNYTFTCPQCKRTYQMLDPTPFRLTSGGKGVQQNTFDAQEEDTIGTGRDFETYVGLSRAELGQLGEQLVQEQGELPEYGKITWWSPVYQNPIDGGTEDHAIEVKTICYDAKNHRFIPGDQKRKGDMIAKATKLGYEKILGLLVILNFQKSLADIYAMEMPVGPWTTQANRPVVGPVAFRKGNGYHLLEEIPFKNPFLNPQSEQPEKYDTGDDIPW